MALKNTRSATAWADVNLYIGLTGAEDALTTNWSNLGYISEDGVTIETEDGEENELKDVNGVLLDSMKKEGTLSITFTLINPSEETRGKFWDLEEDGEEGTNRKVWVKSLINSSYYSIALANPKATGSESFVAPKCSVSMKPTYDATKGFMAEVTCKILTPKSGKTFGFGLADEFATEEDVNGNTPTT